MAGAALVTAGVGVYNAVQGKKAADAAAIEADAARIEMDRHRAEFEKLDTSNPYEGMQNMMTNQYEGMENVMEDLTVNQQGAEFSKQQSMQSQANIMGQMRGSAGASGIAALAQTMANEGALAAQQSSAMIGEQEATNQKAFADQAAANQKLELNREGEMQAEDIRLQDLLREGELKSRDMQAAKNQGLMALSAGDVSSAQALQQQGMEAVSAGIQQAGEGVVSATGSIYDHYN
tara:strand:- start:189 stop:890 length:702 start_codon:yes stop_codon:yes gene_type:complete